MSKKFVVDTERAPRAIGPFSQAVGFGDFLFVSGLYPQDPHTGEFSRAGIEMQTRRTLDNLMGILLAAGLDASHVVKVTVFLRNMNDYHLMNEAYSSYFDYAPPARTVVEVNRLQRDALIAIDAIAAAPVDYEPHAELAAAPPDADTPLDHPGPDDYDDADEADEAGPTEGDADEATDEPAGDAAASDEAGSAADEGWESIELDGDEDATSDGDSQDEGSKGPDDSDSADDSESDDDSDEAETKEQKES